MNIPEKYMNIVYVTGFIYHSLASIVLIMAFLKLSLFYPMFSWLILIVLIDHVITAYNSYEPFAKLINLK